MQGFLEGQGSMAYSGLQENEEKYIPRFKRRNNLMRKLKGRDDKTQPVICRSRTSEKRLSVWLKDEMSQKSDGRMKI